MVTRSRSTNGPTHLSSSGILYLLVHVGPHRDAVVAGDEHSDGNALLLLRWTRSAQIGTKCKIVRFDFLSCFLWHIYNCTMCNYMYVNQCSPQTTYLKDIGSICLQYILMLKWGRSFDVVLGFTPSSALPICIYPFLGEGTVNESIINKILCPEIFTLYQACNKNSILGCVSNLQFYFRQWLVCTTGRRATSQNHSPYGDLYLCFGDSQLVEPYAVLRDDEQHLLLDLVWVEHHGRYKVQEYVVAVSSHTLWRIHNSITNYVHMMFFFNGWEQMENCAPDYVFFFPIL